MVSIHSEDTPIMAIDITEFRDCFPEFADDTVYPDARIQKFIDKSVKQIGTNELHWCEESDDAQGY